MHADLAQLIISIEIILNGSWVLAEEFKSRMQSVIQFPSDESFVKLSRMELLSRTTPVHTNQVLKDIHDLKQSVLQLLHPIQPL